MDRKLVASLLFISAVPISDPAFGVELHFHAESEENKSLSEIDRSHQPINLNAVPYLETCLAETWVMSFVCHLWRWCSCGIKALPRLFKRCRFPAVGVCAGSVTRVSRAQVYLSLADSVSCDSSVIQPAHWVSVKGCRKQLKKTTTGEQDVVSRSPGCFETKFFVVFSTWTGGVLCVVSGWALISLSVFTVSCLLTASTHIHLGIVRLEGSSWDATFVTCVNKHNCVCVLRIGWTRPLRNLFICVCSNILATWFPRGEHWFNTKTVVWLCFYPKTTFMCALYCQVCFRTVALSSRAKTTPRQRFHSIADL